MLTVTPNPIAASTIKSHGSETRTAAGHNPVEAQPQAVQAPSHSSGIGMDAGTILASVNAEAATAGNRTILQTLALAVAAQLNIVRRNDETMESFFLRIASVIDDMPANEQLATEIRSGLKLLKIQLPELSAALKQPDSALAARLSATAEAPLATPQKTAAAAATTSYLQEAAGVSRAAETLAMVTQARTNSEGTGIFSTTQALPLPERQPADARSLQTQLKSLFEPGVAETRIEIAQNVVQQQKVLILGVIDGLADVAAEADVGEQAAALTSAAAETVPGEQAEMPVEENQDLDPLPGKTVILKNADAKIAEAVIEKPASILPEARNLRFGVPELMPETRETAGDERQPGEQRTRPLESGVTPRLQAPLQPHNNNTPNADTRLRAIARDIVQEKLLEKVQAEPKFTDKDSGGERRVQTLLTLKGFAEAVNMLPTKVAELFTTPQVIAQLQEKADQRAKAELPAAGGNQTQGGDADIKAETIDRKEISSGHHPAPALLPDRDAAEEMRSETSRTQNPESQPAARQAEAEQAIALKSATSHLEPVPFAYATLQPAKEEFQAEAAEEKARHQGEDDDSTDQEPEDEEARRERLARKATDDLLRPEPDADPELTITRDSSQADRAYALYQRMGGF